MMNLSDAIRLGAMMKPQAFNGGGWPEKSCGLQAACDAVGISSDDPRCYEKLLDRWPWTMQRRFVCPVCGHGPSSLQKIIALHLNDGHRWERNRIADFVATVEPKETKPVTTNALVEVK